MTYTGSYLGHRRAIGGFGLFSIRERLKQIGGRLEIASEPICGTTVTITAPLKQEKIDAEKDK